MEVITTHAATDFDGLASVLAARHLYPDAVAVLPGALNANVRAFVRANERHLGLADPQAIDLAAVRRLVLVDTCRPERSGRLAELATRADVELLVYDHHGSTPPAWAARGSMVSADGALATTMIELLAARRIVPTPLEATALALAIHEDTGSLTFAGAGQRDAEALAWCLRHGADPGSISRYLHPPLPAEQLELFEQLLASLELVGQLGAEVALATAHSAVYVEGVSELAQRLLELTGHDALVCLVESRGRTVCVVRSRGGRLDAAALAGAFGGGGHHEAASALLDVELTEARDLVLGALPGALAEPVRAREVISPPPPLTPATRVSDALEILRHVEAPGGLVIEDETVVGLVRRVDLERAVGHALAAAPLRALMAPAPAALPAETTEVEARRAAARCSAGVVAITEHGRLLGVVDAGGAPVAAPVRHAGDLAERLHELPVLAPLLPVLEAIGDGHGRVYLVGGAVRDLLLGARSIDVDLAVEGDGPALARALARALHGRAHVHERFGTSVVSHPGGKLDVATARSELYEAPAALPRVAGASIEDDLHRRDFTINAMAVSLAADDLGRLVDPFQGRIDLEHGRLRVLHPLSFVDDPTRLFRAARYAGRYRLLLEPATLELARACVELGLVARLSGHRVADELVLLLGEPRAWDGLDVLARTGALAALHPALTADAETRAIAERADGLRAEHVPELPPWRLRLAALARGATPDDLARWLDGIELRRADAERVADAVAAARHLPGALEHARTPARVYALARPHDPDGVLLALAAAAPGPGHDRLLRYLLALRDVRLEVDGRDLARLGVPESPRVGEILAELHRARLDGEIAGREAELARARLLAAQA